MTTKTYEVTAWRDDPCTVHGQFEAESPQAALALAKEQFLHEFGESCYSSTAWDTFSVSVNGEEVLAESPPAEGVNAQLLEALKAARAWIAAGETDLDELAILERIDPAIAAATIAADWTDQEDAVALKEGWGISWALGVSGEKAEEYRLERVDAMAVFADDAAAWAHVAGRAASGSELHRRALAFIKQNSPAEYARIAAATGKEAA